MQTPRHLTLGSRVVRGANWKWANQDDCSTLGLANEGTVIGIGVGDETVDGWVEVIWDSGLFNFYRMGYEGMYDLALAPSHDPAKLSTYHAIALQSLAMAKASSTHHESNNMVSAKEGGVTSQQTVSQRTTTTPQTTMGGASSLDNSLSSLVDRAAVGANQMRKMMPVADDLSKLVDEADDHVAASIVGSVSSAAASSTAAATSKLMSNSRKSSSTPVLTKSSTVDDTRLGLNVCCGELQQVRALL